MFRQLLSQNRKVSTVGGPMVWLNRGTVSAAATLDITDLPPGYRAIILYFDNLSPATDNVPLWFRTSTDNGSSFDAGASDYNYSNTANGGGSGLFNVSDATSAIIGFAAHGNVAGDAAAGSITIHSPRASGVKTAISHAYSGGRSGGASSSIFTTGGGHRVTAEDNDAVRLLFSSGNIATMNWTLYGLKA